MHQPVNIVSATTRKKTIKHQFKLSIVAHKQFIKFFENSSK